MKKKILSATCALAMIANLVPLPAYAIEMPEGEQSTLVIDAVDADGDGYVEPGEEVEVTVSIQDTGWACEENGLPLSIARIELGFDNSLLTLTKTIEDEDLGPVFTKMDMDTNTSYNVSANTMDGLDPPNEMGCVVLLVEWLNFLGDYRDLPDEKTALFTCHFVAKEGMEGVPQFYFDGCYLNLGHMGTLEDTLTVDAFNVQNNSTLTVDTLAPVITVEGSVPAEGTTYYYQPLTVSAEDNGSGLESLTLDGNAVTDNTVTTGGTLTATDKSGNQSTYTLKVDASAFNAAKEAAAALPETITYTDKAAVAAADEALKAVTDPTAVSKLTAEAEKINAAVAAISAIDEEIAAVKAKIDALPTTGLTVKDAPALSEVETALADLEAKGVQTTDIPNYATYTAAVKQLQAVMDEINAVKDLINALPAAEEVGYGDEAAVQKAEAALQALYAKYADDKEYIADAVGAATLDVIRASLNTLLETQQALVEKIADTQYNITMFEEDVAVITGLRAEVDAMIARDATFTAAELKPLTDAEAALAALTEQSEAAHAAVAALPEADEVLYTQKADIQAVADKMAALDGKDTFTAEETAKLESAQQAIAAIESDITAVTDKIAALPATEQLSVKDAQALDDIQTALADLEAKGVAKTDISNYEVYTAAVEQLQVVMDEINAVKEQIAALPAADEVSFQDEAAVQQAEAALQKLLAAHPDDADSLRDMVKATTLEEVRAALDVLLKGKADLINTIQTTQFTISLFQADIDAITSLRAEVTAMEAKGTTFTSEELANLTAAESDMAALVARSEAAHAALAALPDRDKVLYTEKDKLTQVEQEMEALRELGDTFTAEETGKLTEAQAGIADLEAAVKALAQDMTALKDPADEATPIQYADKANLETMEADITALEDRACDVDSMIAALAAEDETYAGALTRYTNYRTAVKAMVSELDALNADMSKAVAAWTYNDLTDYNAILEKMNAAADKYAIQEDLYEEVFPEYKTIPAKNEEVKAVLDDVLQKVDALPDTEDITLNDAAKVQEITDLLEKLKTEYGFTDAMLTDNLGDPYTVYQSASKKIADLQAAQKPAGDNAQQNNTQPQKTQTAAAPTATPASVAVTIPQTGDPMNLPLAVALLALAVSGMTACVIVRRKNNR